MFFFSSRRRHTRLQGDWSSDVCSSDLTLTWVTAAIGVFGLVMAPMFAAGPTGALMTLVVGLTLMGLTYGPLGTVLSELRSEERRVGKEVRFGVLQDHGDYLMK